ncbi:hypothetical protein MTBBW1_300105 [Desulfamplus magnetovallimortis]|uniref:Uncharacterized protein n=1 Tax=Desulfamplus magnetovallimortis TaxID=1246637 RepID=A0A1W1HFW9_9BACT|nr:hypothetical protein MTBBW1_300105 [Desulfamplus magnetovallimortis]
MIVYQSPPTIKMIVIFTVKAGHPSFHPKGLGSVIKVLISFCESSAESRFVKSSSTYLGHHQ